MQNLTPRYKKDVPQEDLPKATERPSLKNCQIGEGNKLVLPKDIRSQFLQDPVWGAEWREIITQFDSQWSAPIPEGVATDPKTPSPERLVAKKEEAVEQHLGSDEQYWKSVFPGEPETLADFKAKYTDCTDMAGGTTYAFALVPGPKLFVVATDATHIKATESAIIAQELELGCWARKRRSSKLINQAVACHVHGLEIWSWSCWRTVPTSSNFAIIFKYFIQNFNRIWFPTVLKRIQKIYRF